MIMMMIVIVINTLKTIPVLLILNR
jgi:hypothetical protein